MLQTVRSLMSKFKLYKCKTENELESPLESWRPAERLGSKSRLQISKLRNY